MTNYILLGIGGLVIVLGVMFGLPAFNRYQTLANERNQTLVNEIVIQQQEQLVKVEQQKADIRVVEAQGIAKSQAIINSSLTENYLQYLAIQAQEKMAQSPNHTEVYIPSGMNGIPLVRPLP